jgi:hypothetical protein
VLSEDTNREVRGEQVTLFLKGKALTGYTEGRGEAGPKREGPNRIYGGKRKSWS